MSLWSAFATGEALCQRQEPDPTSIHNSNCLCYVISNIFNTDSQVFFKMFNSNPWQQRWSNFSFLILCCSNTQYYLTELLYIWGICKWFLLIFILSRTSEVDFLCMCWPLDFFCEFHVHSSVCSFSIEWLLITCS